MRQSLLLLATAGIWGIAFVAQSVGMEHVGPFTFIAVRFALGALTLVPVILLQSRQSHKGAVHEGVCGPVVSCAELP